MVLTSWDGLSSSQQKLFRTRFFGWGVAAIQKEPKVRLQTQAVGEFVLRCLLMPKKWHIMYKVLSPECKYQKNKKTCWILLSVHANSVPEKIHQCFLARTFPSFGIKKTVQSLGILFPERKIQIFQQETECFDTWTAPWGVFFMLFKLFFVDCLQ